VLRCGYVVAPLRVGNAFDFSQKKSNALWKKDEGMTSLLSDGVVEPYQ
jgi:hypothetical protein